LIVFMQHVQLDLEPYLHEMAILELSKNNFQLILDQSMLIASAQHAKSTLEVICIICLDETHHAFTYCRCIMFTFYLMYYEISDSQY